jgi:lipid-A-disaccharide synthase
MNGASTGPGATPPGTGPLVFLIAGEPSGDALGARLMAALRRRTDGRIAFAGIGGPAMSAEGLRSLFPIDELSLMGIAEVAPHLVRLLGRLRQTVAAIQQAAPAVVVTIDCPGFCLRVAGRLRHSGIPVVHYVAPSVWAWRPGRARRIAHKVDHLLALLPFEPPYFTVHGLPCTYVGHPVIEASIVASPRPADGVRPPVLCLLPGSRRVEIAHLLPVFRQTVGLLRARYPDMAVVLPTIPSVAALVRDAVADWPTPVSVVTGEAARRDAFASADVALAASGTVILELAAAGVPLVACYRGRRLTAAIVLRLLRVRHVTLVNILLDRAVVPELLQDDCTPASLAQALVDLLDDPAARARQRAGFAAALDLLAVDGLPSDRAAAVVLEAMRGRSLVVSPP